MSFYAHIAILIAFDFAFIALLAGGEFVAAACCAVFVTVMLLQVPGLHASTRMQARIKRMF